MYRPFIVTFAKFSDRGGDMRKTFESSASRVRAGRTLRSACYTSLLSVALLAAPSVSHATLIETFDLTSDHCTGSGGCLNGASGGTVTVTDNGTGSLIFDVNLNDPTVEFVNTGLSDADFGFSLSSISTITYSDVSSGFTPVGSNPQNAGTLHMDGTGTFDFGLACTGCGNGGSAPLPGPLDFTITAAGLTLSSLTLSTPNGDNPGQYFAADVIGNGNTGPIDASSISSSSSTGGAQTSSGSPLPEPNSSALTLLGVAMIGLAFMTRSKSKRA
jgi:hypothetical protein